ncbi:low molecular weight protein-tyrosine-phosphatase [Silvanigrella aquatica]|uniref:protein-tyrosine-phosphatase n=1 Tax=Silvanigrella aquatica TaxID=1915309 RepID=A0A1L4CXI9_9BACT|nr:low molecular weight protein-tyrosine-phosphatase [Silvanigrella aquatica]APJ02658.1 hypothetical protein AXG55_01405 [Silvanigrella aquatica]
MEKINSILVVCLGNICRSPYAEYKLKELLKNKNQQNINVSSAGIYAMVGEKAHELSIQVGQERGLNLNAHIARQLNNKLIFENDLILVMDTAQKNRIEENYAAAKGKVRCLGEFRNQSVQDPYGKPYSAYEEMAHLVDDCLNDWVNEILV